MDSPKSGPMMLRELPGGAQSMNCPNCGHPMQRGEVSLEGGSGAVIFRPDQGEKRVVLTRTECNRAFNCEQCRVFTMAIGDGFGFWQQQFKELRALINEIPTLFRRGGKGT